jgi:hypothetical protein
MDLPVFFVRVLVLVIVIVIVIDNKDSEGEDEHEHDGEKKKVSRLIEDSRRTIWQPQRVNRTHRPP